MNKKKRWLADSQDGSVKPCGPFDVIYHVEAPTKTQAIAELCKIAAAALDHPPKLKFKNGAWQMICPHQNGWFVEAGVVERDLGLCSTVVKRRVDITDDTASFNYYASEEYQKSKPTSR